MVNKKILDSLSYSLYGNDWKTRYVGEEEMGRVASSKEDMGFMDVYTSTILISDRYPESVFFQIWFHEFVETCLILDDSENKRKKFMIDKETAANMVANGLCELVRQGVITINTK